MDKLTGWAHGLGLDVAHGVVSGGQSLVVVPIRWAMAMGSEVEWAKFPSLASCI